jgi:hypothetical protein
VPRLRGKGRPRRQPSQGSAALAFPPVTPLDELLKISAPATRALSNAGYTSLGQLADVPRTDVAALHGTWVPVR